MISKNDLEIKFEYLSQRLDVLIDLMKNKFNAQGQIPSYSDKLIFRLIASLKKFKDLDAFLNHTESGEESIEIAYDFLLCHTDHRFKTYASRVIEEAKDSFVPVDNILSQGLYSTFRWKGRSLIKTKEDYAVITTILHDLQPLTIIEIGSGQGTSAEWMSDLLKIHEVPVQVISIDNNEVSGTGDSVEYIQGDAKHIENLLSKDRLKTLPHPWLIVDDAHETIVSVLNYLHGFMEKGDYVFVEDSIAQQKSLGGLMLSVNNSLLVDTYYTDFFGRNSVSAHNSIFKKIS